MARRYICLRHDGWSGTIGEIYIKWSSAAKKKLAVYAKKQRVDQSVLKEVSEHMIYQLACKMESKRAVIKSPPRKLAISRANLDTNQKLSMSGALSSSRRVVQQVRIYLGAKSAVTRFDELEVVGEAVSIPFGFSRAFALSLDYSWGVGIETWTGPTVRRNQPPYGLAAEPGPGNMATSNASSVLSGATRTAGRHCMNPEAAEFYPRTPAIRETPAVREYGPQTRTWGDPISNIGSFDTTIVQQHPFNMCSFRSPAYPEMPPPIRGYYDAPIAPHIPFVQNMPQHPWNPYPQGQKYYNYGTQRWEPEWVGFPHAFRYA